MVLLHRQAPAPFAAENQARPVPAHIAEALRDQLDLQRVEGTNSAVDVFVNTAWVPMRALHPPGFDDGVTEIADLQARPLIAGAALFSGDGDGWTAPVPGDSEILTAHTPRPGWSLTLDGAEVPRREALSWTRAFVLDDPGRGRAELLAAVVAPRRPGDRHRPPRWCSCWDGCDAAWGRPDALAGMAATPPGGDLMRSLRLLSTVAIACLIAAGVVIDLPRAAAAADRGAPHLGAVRAGTGREHLVLRWRQLRRRTCGADHRVGERRAADPHGDRDGASRRLGHSRPPHRRAPGGAPHTGAVQALGARRRRCMARRHRRGRRRRRGRRAADHRSPRRGGPLAVLDAHRSELGRVQRRHPRRGGGRAVRGDAAQPVPRRGGSRHRAGRRRRPRRRGGAGRAAAAGGGG